MHIVAILLFPIRLVTVPLMIPLTGIFYGLMSGWEGPHDTYWHGLVIVSKSWLLWQTGS